MARVLGACRESGKGEESISIANQKKRIQQWADDHGHTVVSWTEDKATSGGTPAAERENLGPWLTESAKISEWDVLATAKLDRGFRSVLDFAQTSEWADQRGKKLVSVTEGYDLTTPEGELMANQLVAFAQFERKRGGQRRAEAAEGISEAGRWGGGRTPFGYMAAGSKGNYRLIKDDVNTDLALRMAEAVINGRGFLTVANEFNTEGIPSPWGKTWSGFTVKRILTSPAMIGYVTKTIAHRETVIFRDSHGQPVRFTDNPILTDDQWRAVQDAVRKRVKKRDMPQARLLLYHVAYCADCSPMDDCGHSRPCSDHDAPMKGYRRTKHINKGNRYFCPRCPNGTSMRHLEATVTSEVLGAYGHRKLLERTIIPGDDHATEIARLQRRAERLRAELDEEFNQGIAHAVAEAEAKIAELESTPHQPDRPVWLPVVPEITVADYWESSDDKTRNQLLLDYGFAFWIKRSDIVRAQGAWVPADEDIFRL
jgi:DNA invertase Pin-like site-specific DNA recombinase